MYWGIWRYIWVSIKHNSLRSKVLSSIHLVFLYCLLNVKILKALSSWCPNLLTLCTLESLIDRSLRLQQTCGFSFFLWTAVSEMGWYQAVLSQQLWTRLQLALKQSRGHRVDQLRPNLSLWPWTLSQDVSIALFLHASYQGCDKICTNYVCSGYFPLNNAPQNSTYSSIHLWRSLKLRLHKGVSHRLGLPWWIWIRLEDSCLLYKLIADELHWINALPFSIWTCAPATPMPTLIYCKTTFSMFMPRFECVGTR